MRRMSRLLLVALFVVGGTFWSNLAIAQITCAIQPFSCVDYGADLPGYAPPGQQTIQLPSLTLGGITVTGSDTLNFLEFNGVGVVGGFLDITIDEDEFAHFNFDVGPVTDVSILDPIGTIPPSTIEVFGLGGVSLGVIESPGGFFSISALVGNVPITSFQFNGNNGVGRVNFVAYKGFLSSFDELVELSEPFQPLFELFEGLVWISEEDAPALHDAIEETLAAGEDKFEASGNIPIEISFEIWAEFAFTSASATVCGTGLVLTLVGGVGVPLLTSCSFIIIDTTARYVEKHYPGSGQFHHFELEFSVQLDQSAARFFVPGDTFVTKFPSFGSEPSWSILEILSVVGKRNKPVLRIRVRGINLLKISKAVTDGPDRPDAIDGSGESDGATDAVVEVGQTETTEYTFEITYANPEGPEVVVIDEVPAEWQVIEVAGNIIVDGFGSGSDGNGGTVDVMPSNKKPNNRSATIIEWAPDIANDSSTINVVVETRSKRSRFLPRDCGALSLNDAALVFAVDEAGGLLEPPIFQSHMLLLAAIEDVNGDGHIGRDGTGDEDGDGLTDFQEINDIGTDPCLTDTDGDGVPDGSDADPLNP